MAVIQLRGADAASMQSVSTQLADDLQQLGLPVVVQVTNMTEPAPMRGDPVIWGAIATAVAAGGALTAFLGKEGGLSALARVLEKYVESRKVEVAIKTDDGKDIKLSGSLAAIKAVLKQV